jgi:hypothetical protein
MYLPEYYETMANYYNLILIEVIVNVEYKKNIARSRNTIYHVYESTKRTPLGTPDSEYRTFNIPSQAAKYANSILKKKGYTGVPIKYTDLKKYADTLIKRAQHIFDKKYLKEKITNFKNDFEKLLKKYNMHIVVETNGDYYNDWRELTLTHNTIKEDGVNFIDLVAELETTKNV